MRDTIFALVTAPGRSAVAIIRVSGPSSGALLKQLCGALPKPRSATLKRILAPDGEILDQGLVLWFPAPNSFTGEDVFELQLHGGLAIVEAVSAALQTMGARPAEPGEFTRRAFEVGLLDLSQAEAVADLVDAETQAQRRQALAQFGGAITRRGLAWRETLLTALALLEAQIDFPDEEIPADVAETSRAPLIALARDIEAVLVKAQGERVRDGVRIALVGAPNAGKSSLLNALVEREAAIVNAVPGTTRDVIEVGLVIAGYKVILADTAGLRDATDEVEIEGVRRARAWAQSADLRLWLVDAATSVANIGFEKPDFMKAGDVLVLTKTDMIKAHRTAWATVVAEEHFVLSNISTMTEDGVNDLRELLEGWVVSNLAADEFPAVTQMRHRLLLSEALGHLQRALSRPADFAELVAEDVRLVSRSLEKLSGKLHPDDVLDRVFSSFCIGK